MLTCGSACCQQLADGQQQVTGWLDLGWEVSAWKTIHMVLMHGDAAGCRAEPAALEAPGCVEGAVVLHNLTCVRFFLFFKYI